MSDDGTTSITRLLVLVVVGLGAILLTSWIVEGARPERVTATTAATADGYRLWATREDGSAVRWNHCDTIDWVINPDRAPEGAAGLVSEAFARITAVTGLQFRHLGTTDERPQTNRSTQDAERYGSTDWSPVLVAWTSPDETTPLRDTDQGVAIPVAVDGVFVTGQIILNADVWLAPDFTARSLSWGGALLHEAGHLVGLDHVEDRTQLMHGFTGSGGVVLGGGKYYLNATLELTALHSGIRWSAALVASCRCESTSVQFQR